MLLRVRAVRAATGVLVAAAMLAATATTAAAAEDEGELVDVTKTVSSLEKKMADLGERGQRARKGESVCIGGLRRRASGAGLRKLG